MEGFCRFPVWPCRFPSSICLRICFFSLVGFQGNLSRRCQGDGNGGRSTRPPARPPARPPTHSPRPSVRPSIHPSIHPSMHPSHLHIGHSERERSREPSNIVIYLCLCVCFGAPSYQQVHVSSLRMVLSFEVLSAAKGTGTKRKFGLQKTHFFFQLWSFEHGASK